MAGHREVLLEVCVLICLSKTILKNLFCISWGRLPLLFSVPNAKSSTLSLRNVLFDFLWATSTHFSIPRFKDKPSSGPPYEPLSSPLLRINHFHMCVPIAFAFIQNPMSMNIYFIYLLKFYLICYIWISLLSIRFIFAFPEYHTVLYM